jgi:hypothetical protein
MGRLLSGTGKHRANGLRERKHSPGRHPQQLALAGGRGVHLRPGQTVRGLAWHSPAPAICELYNPVGLAVDLLAVKHGELLAEQTVLRISDGHFSG